MEKPVYKLSKEFIRHSDEVRAVTNENNNIITASKDCSTILWMMGEDGNCNGDLQMVGHQDCVISVCYVEPSQRYPKGLIITGGYDSHICLYVTGEANYFKKIHAHCNAVSCLRPSIADKQAFLSCSWDGTARLWNLNDIETPQVTYTAHDGDLWCVADLKNSHVVTGSSNNTVVIYKRDGTTLKMLCAHTDSVTDICAVSDAEFLTCSDDGEIKLWNSDSGESLRSFKGHRGSVYSMSVLDDGRLAVSTGDDRSIIVWIDGEVGQIIHIPVRTLCVALLPNKDIVCGAADGRVRTFTSEPSRYADADTMKAFEDALIRSVVNPENSNSGNKSESSSAPKERGKKDGETRVVQDGSAVIKYIWSQRKSKWKLKWDSYVTAQDSPSTSSFNGKPMYDGQEYDYVFSVDIEDGAPPLKLPYNNGEDPREVAQKFIDENNLEDHHYRQIVDFIRTNTRVSRRGKPRFFNSLRGRNRSSFSESVDVQSPQASAAKSYIPHSNYVKISDSTDLAKIREKLLEFNSKDGTTKEPNQSVSTDQLESLIKLATDDPSDAGIEVLKKLLRWPDDFIFPVLDIARLAVLNKHVNDKICTDELIDLLLPQLTRESPKANKMLTFRLLANMFHHESGKNIGVKYRIELMTYIINLLPGTDGKSQIAISSYILNLVLAAINECNFEDRIMILTSICELIHHVTDHEAMFRILLGLGTMLYLSSEENRSPMVASILQFPSVLDLFAQLDPQTTDVPEKLKKIKRELYNLISSS